MDRRGSLKAIGACAASVAIGGCFDNMKSSSAGSVESKPNFLFIIADDCTYRIIMASEKTRKNLLKDQPPSEGRG